VSNFASQTSERQYDYIESEHETITLELTGLLAMSRKWKQEALQSSF
jgi:hypothetical protein